MIDELGDELLNNVPYASSITSLMELSIPIGTDDGFEVKSHTEPVLIQALSDFCRYQFF